MLFIQIAGLDLYPGRTIADTLALENLDDFRCWCEPGHVHDEDDNRIPCLVWKISVKGQLVYEMPVQPTIKLLPLTLPA